jgi:hypothetical protein
MDIVEMQVGTYGGRAAAKGIAKGSAKSDRALLCQADPEFTFRQNT